ncbi:hypothetical protein [Streptomyces sp. URMC 123]|uniref:hypothetical protein n=1 Tax=Streptomyces sp. URMC 123 TaxID=3423403 RepID=UPI003F1DDE12
MRVTEPPESWAPYLGTALSAAADGRDGARMTLASAGKDGGAGKEDLAISGGPWTGASGVAESIRNSQKEGMTRLSTGHDGFAGGTAGFDSATALGEIRSGWNDRLKSVHDECDSLIGALRSAGKEFGEVDKGVKADLDRIRKSSIDDYGKRNNTAATPSAEAARGN